MKFQKAVRFPSAGMAVGMFANRKTALIKTENGQDVLYRAQTAITTFSSAKCIFSVGTCYAFDKEIKIGDIIVSKEIASLKIQYKGDGLIVECSDTTEVYNGLKNIFCENTVQDFEVSNNGRLSNVHSGKFISFPAFVDSEIMCKKFQAAVSGVIGGEKEGATLVQFQRQGMIKGVILIKGVVDYGEGDRLKNEEWYFTASKAAVNYIKSKLDACEDKFLNRKSN